MVIEKQSLVSPLNLAQSLIRCPSVTPDDAGALDCLKEALDCLGFTSQIIVFGEEEGRSPIRNLYAKLGTSRPNLCFAGHTDVVPVGGSWDFNPFSGDVVEDYLYGRGAVDMKGAIACFVAAIARSPSLLQQGGAVSLLITGDEEGKALDGTIRVLDWLKSQGESLDFCIVGEPTNPQELGDMIKIGRRGSLNGHLIVRGTQGHVAYPHLADNPLPRLIKMLSILSELFLDEGTDDFQASRLEITSIDVGNKVTNIIPSSAEAKFNIRFNDLHSFESLKKLITEQLNRIDSHYDLHLELGAKVYHTEKGILTKALSQSIYDIVGKEPEFSTTGGTSDGRFIRDFCPVAEFGLVNKTMHKINESVSLRDLETLTEIYQHTLKYIFENVT
jgi:succinyl-diaminopimelate desuccinylase